MRSSQKTITVQPLPRKSIKNNLMDSSISIALIEIGMKKMMGSSLCLRALVAERL
jgi:hypothetical protein